MNAMVPGSQLVSHFSEFFAPVKPDLLAGLIKQRDQKRVVIEGLKETMESPEIRDAMTYFLAADHRKTEQSPFSAKQSYDLEGAIAGLDAEFWDKALKLTDVMEYMPQKRRTEWWEQVRDCKTPEFNADTVYPTIRDLLDARAKFLAERVDGMFRSLSGEHVTNSPTGFNKRMIIADVVDKFGIPDWKKTGVIDDLRKVIARFVDREDPRVGSTSEALRVMCSDYGQWFDLDGGVVRARLYKKGTVHLEVHPDIAWRLNEILAYLYPKAIASGARKPPARRSKEFRHILRPIPREIVSFITEAIRYHRYSSGENVITLNRLCSSGIGYQVKEVLGAIGGVMVKVDHRRSHGFSGDTTVKVDAVKFDYNPREVLAHLICSGCLPDKRSYQFYPTPADLADEVVGMAQIEDGHSVLEPSAGQGGLADKVGDPGRVFCIELSQLHAEILSSKGYQVERGDFIKLAASHYNQFDRVIMNPPFSEGRALHHIEEAIKCLKPGGRLVAVAPSSVAGHDFPGASSCEYSEIMCNRFADASVNTVIVTVVR